MAEPRTIDLSKLSPEQLDQLRQQLSQEVNELEGHARNLQMIAGRFQESRDALEDMAGLEEDHEIMLPLTSSVYVPARLKDVKHVMLDIGTGYYAKNSVEGSKAYAERKVKHSRQQFDDLAQAIAVKRKNLEAVVMTLQMRMQQAQAQREQ